VSEAAALAPGGEIAVYQAADGSVRVEARLERETVWLTKQQMAELFGRERSVISKHIRNAFGEGELEPQATCANFAQVRQEGGRTVSREVDHYNLDVIISVGYRVKSAQGTRFRIWATGVLRQHLVRGYTVNEARLRDLNQAVRLVADTARRRELSGDEAQALLAVVADYNRALALLDDYDHQRVTKPATGATATWVLQHDEALRIVDRLRGRFGASALFGVEKDQGLASALGAVMQTFGGEDLYPSLEEKAAQLLYLLVKNHAFVDGNKRIAAALFLWFLERNGALRHADGTSCVSDGALVALTLMIAESRPQEKDVLVRIVMHLLVSGDHA
jgi:prophage maintenance system killer protein